MYEAFFGFAKRPFASVPKPEQYFPGAAIEAARQTLARCIERAEGVGILVGPSGTGKTLLCQLLAQQFRETFEVVLLSSGRLSTRKALLQAILFELGQPYRGMDEGELRLAMVDYLTAHDKCNDGMVLLVDEAHTLPLRLLEEIRMITNLVSQGEPRTRLVLSGNALLEERFASPKLESFCQRIVARCYLESLNRSETERYVHSQIENAGRNGHEILPPGACQAVYQATDGIPRLINQVCDHALLLACANGANSVDRTGIDEAWADLQQLPTPWIADTPEGETEEVVIEFGGLDEDDDEPSEGPDADANCLPMLRVAESCDEPEELEEPARQVEQIQDALSGIDCDSRMGQTTGPEVEVVCEEAHDPFSEQFEDEEIISGSFTTHAEDPAGKLPEVLPIEQDPADPSTSLETQPGEDDGRMLDEPVPLQAVAQELGDSVPEEETINESGDSENDRLMEEVVAPSSSIPATEAATIGAEPWIDDGSQCVDVSLPEFTFLDEVVGSDLAQPALPFDDIGTSGLIEVETHFEAESATGYICQTDAVAAGEEQDRELGPASIITDDDTYDVQTTANDADGEASIPFVNDDVDERSNWDMGPETVPLRREPETGESERSARAEEDVYDDDMIIVEDGYEDPETTHNHPSPRIRRQEYRQLFARLRQGSS